VGEGVLQWEQLSIAQLPRQFQGELREKSDQLLAAGGIHRQR
jgi:hypothetical protein